MTTTPNENPPAVSDHDEISGPHRVPSPLSVSLSLIVFGIIGFIAAFSLTLDKFALLANPDVDLSCNISVLVGCSTNLNSEQGEVFGFPNPLLGLAFWTAAIVLGVAMLAGATFARWFWALYALFATAALALVIWFISQSIFVLHVLCPWCMVTWAVTIPTFWLLMLHALRSGAIPVPAPVRRFAAALFGWIPIITLVCYLIVAVLAQVQLDVISEFTS